MYNIYCLQGFNNYYNRIVKRINTLEAYLTYQDENNKGYMLYENINFVPNDCVNTNQILNWSESWLPDYFVIEDSNTHIFTRWFVVESIRQRGQQYLFQLRRDLFADFYDSIIKAPCFVEKASLTYENPLIFNKEDIAVNQIKTSETEIRDKSDCAWLVGYYSKGSTLTGTVDINAEPEAIPVNSNNITSWEFYRYKDTAMIGPQSSGFYIFNYIDGPAMSPVYFRMEVNESDGNSTRNSISPTTDAYLQHFGAFLLVENDFETGFKNFGLNNLNPAPYSGVSTRSDVNELLAFDGKLIKTLDGKYYRIRTTASQKTETISINSGQLFNDLSAIVRNIGLTGTPTTDTFKYKFTALYYKITITEEEALSTKYDITSTKLVTEDAPWDIFAIPYGKITVWENGNKILETSMDYAISTAASIQAQHPSTVYDIQLVPYCPVQNLIIGKGALDLNDNANYSFIRDKNNVPIGVIFNVPKSTFDFTIAKTIEASKNAIERKLNSECDKWRLTAPNYSNYFDFSVEKNNGISAFNVDITYKPYSPYIHINPVFSGLYGYDDNSPRGLVLGGDFSLSQIIDQWQQYQIQNKNFQNIFDRQIQNLELTQSIQRTQDIFKTITGTATGATSGAFVGNMLGNVGIGAGIGGAASLAGGLTDIALNERLRNETLDYTKDMFGYQLGNIQALPITISKVSALNNNNKIFPILEFYTCTNTEKIAVLNKIAYNGMTVMAIGKMENYIGREWSYTIYDNINEENTTVKSRNYIKGRLIKIEDINCDDFHVANEIAAEVFKGVYI